MKMQRAMKLRTELKREQIEYFQTSNLHIVRGIKYIMHNTLRGIIIIMVSLGRMAVGMSQVSTLQLVATKFENHCFQM